MSRPYDFCEIINPTLFLHKTRAPQRLVNVYEKSCTVSVCIRLGEKEHHRCGFCSKLPVKCVSDGFLRDPHFSFEFEFGNSKFDHL